MPSERTAGLASQFVGGVFDFVRRRLRKPERAPLIERAYDRVTTRLCEVMHHLIAYGRKEMATLEKVAETLGIEIPTPTLSEAQERAVAYEVWRPVAQISVHCLLPALITETAKQKSALVEYPRAEHMWRDHLQYLAQRASLSLDDAKIVASTTGLVFFETDLFDGSETVLVGEDEFRITRTPDNALRIEALGSARGSIDDGVPRFEERPRDAGRLIGSSA